RWEETSLGLEQEAEGLESRIQNGRRKLQDLEQELLRLQAVLRDLHSRREALAKAEALPKPDATSAPQLDRLPPPLAKLAFLQADLKRRERDIGTARADLAQAFQALERVAGDLADQRLELAEQCARLMQARQRWQEDREAAASELTALGQRL